MKKYFLIFSMVAVLMCGFSGIASANNHVFNLVNYTGIDIYAVYISPSNTNNWGPNILNGVLYNGYQVPINLFSYNSSWDLKIADVYGNQVYWRYIPLSSLSSYTLYP